MRAAALSGLLGLAGCGYQFAARGGPLPSGVETVEVPVLRNQTTEPGIEGFLTDDLRHRLAQLGYAGDSSARATLVATVVGAGNAPLAPKVGPVAGTSAYSVGYAPGLYQVSLAVSAKLMRGDELLWQVDSLSMTERYLPSDDLATLEARRREALRRLSRTLAKELVARLTSGL